MLFFRNKFDDCEIAVWKIEESVDEILSLFDMRQRCAFETHISEFKRDKRKFEFLLPRLLLNMIAGSALEIAYKESGRPFVVDSDIEINISHTDGYVAVILHDKKRVSIDIEARRDKALRLKDRFMSEDELSVLVKGREEDAALIHWSAKETLFKIMNETDVDFIKHLHVSPFEFSEAGAFFASESKTELARTYELKYFLFDDFVMIWTVDR